MSIDFLPETYDRVTRVTVVVPTGEQDDLVDPWNLHEVIPTRIEITLRHEEGTQRGDRFRAYVAVIGPRRLKSGQAGQEIRSTGWEKARNEGRNHTADRPDWLTGILVRNLPAGWNADILELSKVATG